MSNYKYGFKIEEISGSKYILVIDNCCPCHSTEFHMEEVVKEITIQKNIEPLIYCILRKDCNRKWSMWDQYHKKFIDLDCNSLIDSIAGKFNTNRDSVID